jgi:hypothetical protein
MRMALFDLLARSVEARASVEPRRHHIVVRRSAQRIMPYCDKMQ